MHLSSSYLLVLESFVRDDVFLALGCVKVDRELDSLRLVHTQWQVRLLLQVFQTEPLQILLSECLCVQEAGRWGTGRLARGTHSC